MGPDFDIVDDVAFDRLPRTSAKIFADQSVHRFEFCQQHVCASVGDVGVENKMVGPKFARLFSRIVG